MVTIWTVSTLEFVKIYFLTMVLIWCVLSQIVLAPKTSYHLLFKLQNRHFFLSSHTTQPQQAHHPHSPSPPDACNPRQATPMCPYCNGVHDSNCVAIAGRADNNNDCDDYNDYDDGWQHGGGGGRGTRRMHWCSWWRLCPRSI